MLPPKPSKSIKKLTKKVSQRGKAFNKEEDRIICSAFLNVSKDPITGTLFSLNYQISCHITLRQFSSSHIYIYCQEQTNLVDDITKGCMTTSMSTLEHLPVEVSKLSSIVGWLYKRRLTNSVDIIQQLKGWMRAEKMSRTWWVQPVYIVAVWCCIHAFAQLCPVCHRLMMQLNCMRTQSHGHLNTAGTYCGMNRSGMIKW